MVSCFQACRSGLAGDADDDADWSPGLVQDLYSKCMTSNNGNLIVYGLFARANAVNDNRRLYPKTVLKREVKRYIRDQIRNGCALGELDHPSYSSPTFKCLNLPNISHQVLDVKWKGNTLWGYIQVLDTPSGNLIRNLYKQGHKLGVSSRGWASLRELPGKQYKCIMDNFELITFDFVTEPSTHGAWLLPYAANYLGAVPDQRRAEELSSIGVGALPIECSSVLPNIWDAHEAAATYARTIQAVRTPPCLDTV